MKTKRYLICIILCSMLIITVSSACREIPVDKKDLLGNDFRLFQGTKAWELAKAVEDENIEGIKFQVNKVGIPVDYKEERFGETLLMLAVRNNKYMSAKTLLELGADPNEPDDTINNSGENAVIIASEFSRISPNILRLLLEQGGNPNSVCRGMQEYNDELIPIRHFALYDAVPIFGDFEKVRILVEAGADVNMQTEDTGAGAIEVAIIRDRMDVLLYLLENGGDYHKKFEQTDYENSPDSVFYEDLLYELRYCFFPIGSKEHKYKLKVIDFLRKRGLDYWKSPLPKDAIEIIKKEIKPKTEEELKEYIQKY